MKSNTLLKTDNPNSNYQRCLFYFSEIKKELDQSIKENYYPLCSIKPLPKRNKFLNLSMKIILLFGIISFYGCAKAQEPKAITYTIKKGDFYSDHGLGTCKDELKYEVKFDASCAYDIDDVEQADINKLFGFCPIYTPHHIKSARFGWRYYNDSLEIHAYIYDKGKRFSEKITVVEFDQYNDYTLKETRSEYLFYVNDIEYVYKKNQKGKASLNLQLYPYFGGNTRAPHTMYLYFKKLK
jgi:hypothetical protein